MSAALLVLATSKLPFYLIGGALAAWAVLLALAGLSRPDFPGGRGPARGIMGISALLVVGTIGSAIATASKPKHEAPAEKGAPAASGGTVKLAADPGGQLRYDTKSLTAKAGKVTIDFVNQAPIPHNVTIEGAGKSLGQTKTISGGNTTATLDLKPGTYTFFCSVDAHRQAGMQGQLKVS
jgi:plastocyanin